MTPDDYIRLANRTAKNMEDNDLELFHIALGISGESGEVSDAIKKALIYGGELDHTNVQEELGDLMWYIARYCYIYGTSLENIMTMNINKLQIRFPNKFTTDDALTRDLGAERKDLELHTNLNKQET